jgi:dTDP-glucose pyrophosphorylase
LFSSLFVSVLFTPKTSPIANDIIFRGLLLTTWQKMLIRPSAPLVEAVKIVDSGGGQIAIVTDGNNRLLGVITDANIREALLAGKDFNSPCSIAMTATPIAINVVSDFEDRLDVMRGHHISQLPLIDDEGRVVDVALLMEMVSPQSIPNPVMIMAGGLGSRLGHLTTAVPKPLLNVGSRPLLETILHQAIDQGFREFFFSVNYKAEMIINHFGDGSRWGVEIKYLREQALLGTAGSLSMLPKGLDKNIIVINGDILTKVDFRRMLSMHSLNKAELTVAVKESTHTVPYGVVEIGRNSMITSFREKPTQTYFINAGMYVISPAALAHVPSNTYFDIPSLLEVLFQNRMGISAFPIREYWLDIGKMQDYEQANLEFDNYFPSDP